MTFTPAVGYAGTARFRYTASDAGGLTASALVVLTIASLDKFIEGSAAGETLTGFGGDDTIAGLDLERMPRSLRIELPLTHADDNAAGRLVLDRVGQEDAAGSLLFARLALDHNAVAEGNESRLLLD